VGLYWAGASGVGAIASSSPAGGDRIGTCAGCGGITRLRLRHGNFRLALQVNKNRPEKRPLLIFVA